jgi:hypothetical protein
MKYITRYTSSSWCIAFSLDARFKLQTKTSLIQSKTSHLDVWTFMECAYPSYAHIVLWMSLTHWIKFEPKIYAQMLHQCIISSSETIW